MERLKMSSDRFRKRKLFTVEEANATLPLVRAIVGDLTDLSRDLVERQERLATLTPSSIRRSGDPYQQEMDQVERDLERDSGRVREYVEELLALGVEPKSATEGLVDFPAVIDGRKVYLCWKLGEPEVLFWHGLEAGYAGRRPLMADSMADGEAGESDGGRSF